MKRRLALYGLGTILVVLAAVVLLLPSLVDTPAVRAEIQRRLAQALQGQVTWQALGVALLPAPHAELYRVRVDIPEKLSASAEEVKVHLRFWPLLRGRAEISSVTLTRPQLRISPGKSDAGGPLDALAAYRAAIEPMAQALQQYAPDMALRIEGASVDPGKLRDLDFSARTGATGVELKLSAASDLWKRLAVDGRIEYADLAARARIEVDALVVDADLPPARLRARLRTDAKTAIECEFDASLGALGSARGKVLLPAGKPAQISAQMDAVDVAQAIALARRKGTDLDVIESAEGRLSVKADLDAGPPWHLQLDVVKSDAGVKLAALPWKLSVHAARLSVTPERLRVAGLRGAAGDSPFSDVGLQLDFAAPARLSAASGKATLSLEQWFPWLQTKAPLDDVASLSGSVEVALNRLALRFDRPAQVEFDAVATPRKVSAALRMLPAPVSVDGGSVQVGAKQVRLTRVAARMLDAHALVSGTLTLQNSALELAIAEGVAGEKLVRWALERGAVPARLEPKTPIRLSAQRIAWAPQGALEADTRLEFDRGPGVGIALALRPGLLELRRLSIKDAHSDATVSATVADDLVQATFSGTLLGRSIAAMLRQSPSDSGSAQGELRFTIDRAQPQRSVAEGHLRVEALDLSWLAGKRAIVESIDLTAGKEVLRIADARLDWEEQRFGLRGVVRRTDEGPVIEARLESAGLDLERVLPPPRARAPGEKKVEIFPLPVSGRIEVRTGFVNYKRYRIEPFDGILSLERQRARLEVKEARMCGVSFPLEVEAVQAQIVASIHLAMKNEPLEETMRCLTGDTVQITGNADFSAELRTHGRRPNLLRNLTGSAQAELRQGRVKKFALLGNILSVRNIGSVQRMREDGFAYRGMSVRGHFEGGGFVVEEGAFDSDAVNLAATGRVDLLGADSRLTVLVGLLTFVDRMAGAIPILGDIFGGSLTALPISVSGDIRDPLVVPLDPRAITEHLLGILGRTAKLPGKLLLPAPALKEP